MAQLLVRNVDDALVEALKARAQKRGRSVEEEHRRILKRVLFPKPKRTLKEMLLTGPKIPPELEHCFEVSRADDVRSDPFADEGEEG